MNKHKRGKKCLPVSPFFWKAILRALKGTPKGFLKYLDKVFSGDRMN
jgi:hypothetical protein